MVSRFCISIRYALYSRNALLKPYLYEQYIPMMYKSITQSNSAIELFTFLREAKIFLTILGFHRSAIELTCGA